MKLVSEELLELSPADAKNLKIEDGDYVKVSSRRGKLRVKAKVTPRSQKGKKAYRPKGLRQ